MHMDLTTFKESIVANKLPAQVSVYLKALWQDANGNWKEAHRLIQDLPDEKAAWIHAYLHRKEGDTGNADYWYRRAGKDGRRFRYTKSGSSWLPHFYNL